MPEIGWISNFFYEGSVKGSNDSSTEMIQAKNVVRKIHPFACMIWNRCNLSQHITYVKSNATDLGF